MSKESATRCAIYTRKSSEEGLEQEFNSLDAQREACAAYVTSQKSEGWKCLSQSYDDGGFSGGTLERPALQRLLSDIESGRIDVVVVYKIDRLSRSLMDFAKLVEVFERRKVTFVSVTQSFNTTTSMGRLTLNVLLSFAQFERELTGERIRDKFAASKKKGMWMGGRPPLGYDIRERKLVANSTEAGTVKLIFERYLELGCVRALRDDLKARNISPKRWQSSTGRDHGQEPFDRGALYCLLQNRVYVGETVHKDAIYPGEHKPIIARDLFERVQQRFADTRRRQPGNSGQAQNALLESVLFDVAGAPMTPSYSSKPDGRRYRYYVSQSVLTNKAANTSNAITRLPAPAIEDLVSTSLARLSIQMGVEPIAIRSLLNRIEVRPSTIVIQLNREPVFQCWRESIAGIAHLSDQEIVLRQAASLGPQERLELQSDDILLLTLPVRAKFRGGRSTMAQPGQGPAAKRPDSALIRAVARAHQWRQWLEDGEVGSIDALAKRVAKERRHVAQTIGLAFLSPALTKAILQGTQAPSLRLSTLLDSKIPLTWNQQHAMFGLTPARN